MSEKPILFSSEMVRAILEGRKTQTRRIIHWNTKDPYKTHIPAHAIYEGHNEGRFQWYDSRGGITITSGCKYGKPSDLLWVRESLRRYKKLEFLGEDKYTAQYIATNTAVPYANGAKAGWCGTALWQWKNTACPSIHMPRWACRIVLEIIDVKVERLQDISESDAWDEGISDQLSPLDINGIVLFKSLWDSINLKLGYSWESNPWVWVIKFEMDERLMNNGRRSVRDRGIENHVMSLYGRDVQ
jgi:hypothetical protein